MCFAVLLFLFSSLAVLQCFGDNPIRTKRYYDFTLTVPGKVVNVNGKHPLITVIELIPWAASGFPMKSFPLFPGNTLSWIP
ncbi:hypothetical protein L596_015149 [Steinernema carpocapsae]|uniref:Carboxylesterase type B domain-containing protein n=1 Tax=Steinernema carpocapsae TaxID=34508 RepID=A0A4V6A313_STECR|nr:hypothetical protein L596_015149 [Steinernema carpocapsae]